MSTTDQTGHHPWLHGWQFSPTIPKWIHRHFRGHPLSRAFHSFSSSSSIWANHDNGAPSAKTCTLPFSFQTLLPNATVTGFQYEILHPTRHGQLRFECILHIRHRRKRILVAIYWPDRSYWWLWQINPNYSACGFVCILHWFDPVVRQRGLDAGLMRVSNFPTRGCRTNILAGNALHGDNTLLASSLCCD